MNRHLRTGKRTWRKWQKKISICFCIVMFILPPAVLSCLPCSRGFTTDTNRSSLLDTTEVAKVNELTGHTGAVLSLAWSPCGKWLTSGSMDTTIRLWNTSTWDSQVLVAHDLGVWALAWSPDGSKFASGGKDYDKIVRLWNPETGEQLSSFDSQMFYVLALAWSPNGALLAAGGQPLNGIVSLFDPETGALVKTLKGKNIQGSNPALSLAWSSDGTRLVGGFYDGTISLWDAQTGQALLTLFANTTARNDTNGLAWSPDETILASAGQDGNVRLWDVQTGEEILCLSGHVDWAKPLLWLRNEQILTSGGQDGSVRLWDPKTGEELVCLREHTASVWSMALSPDGDMWASGSGRLGLSSYDTRIVIWRIPDNYVVPDDYATIQEAINKARDGDTIYVRAGTYDDAIIVNRTVSLVGEDRNTTLLCGDETTNVLTVTRNCVNIAGFTIQTSDREWPTYNICMKNVSLCSIHDNVLINGFCGVNISEGSRNSVFENIVVNNSIGICGACSNYNSIYENTITANDLAGVSLHLCSHNNMTRNVLDGNSKGIQLLDGSNNNTIHHNNFISNDVQAYIESCCGNTWDDGYPSGGNYWSDYSRVDLHNGVYQNMTGSDAIGDMPYVVDADNCDNYPLMKPFAGVQHDIGITGVAVRKTIVGQGYSATTIVIVFNYGNNTETFDVAISANTTLINTFAGVVLPSGDCIILSCTWNTSSWSTGCYTLSAVATQVEGETDVTDNVFTYGVVKVTIPGDVDGDFFVNIADAAQVSLYWLKLAPLAVADVDINSDGIVSIKDATLVGLNWFRRA